MLKFALSVVLVLTVIVSADRVTSATPASATTEFAGGTPCGEEVRRFLGISNPACEQIGWHLSLAPGNAGSFELRARYHMPIPGSPNHLDGGNTLQLRGQWTSAPGTGAHDGRVIYTLTVDGRSLRLALFEHDLLQMLTSGNRLMVGNAGWSYTLNRGMHPSPRAPRRMEKSNAAAAGLGGQFEGRTPCQEISKQLSLAVDAGCIKLKWGFTFLQDEATGRPTTYKLQGTLYRDGRLQAAAPRTGKWSLLRDGSTGALIYRLERDEPGGYMLLMRADENVLFFLDKEGNALVGNESFSYTLNRVVRRS